MRLVVTGTGGMLGGNIARSWGVRHEVRGLDRNATWECKGDVLDLTDASRLDRRLEELEPDAIVHCAALTNVDYCEKHADAAAAVNVGVTRSLAEFSGRRRVPLIYVSTDAVFDGAKMKPYTEDDKVNPLNVYGRTKGDGELAVSESCDEFLIVRTNIFGWTRSRRKTSFAEWVYENLANSRTIQMFTDIRYTPMYVGDFIDLLGLLMESRRWGLYHLAGAEVCTKLEFGMLLQRCMAATTAIIEPASFTSRESAAPRSAYMALDSSKTARTLGVAIPGLDRGVERFLLERDGAPRGMSR
jgi:dTDP-4-dehydrorhamnose reductase